MKRGAANVWVRLSRVKCAGMIGTIVEPAFTIGNLREIFEVPLQSQYFPVQLDQMGGQFEFLKVEDASKHFTDAASTVETTVTGQRLNHPGGAYGFRIERNGKVLVICADVEHGGEIDS